jgi:hypothetical protein
MTELNTIFTTLPVINSDNELIVDNLDHHYNDSNTEQYNDEYHYDEYHNDEYHNDEYHNDEYHNDEYHNDEYHNDEYHNDEYNSEIQQEFIELHTDDNWSLNQDQELVCKKIKAIKIVQCLLILSFDQDKLINAWHIAGMDLAILINQEQRMMFSMLSKCEVESVDDRFKSWYNAYKNYKTVIIGPKADEAAKRKFRGTCYPTVKGPVDIEYDFLEKNITIIKDNKVIDTIIV